MELSRARNERRSFFENDEIIENALFIDKIEFEITKEVKENNKVKRRWCIFTKRVFEWKRVKNEVIYRVIIGRLDICLEITEKIDKYLIYLE